METIEVPKNEFELMRLEIQTLRNTRIYRRLLEFERNIAEGRKYSRKDLGF